MFKVNIIDLNKTIEYNNNITLEEIAKSENIVAFGAKVNNRLRELTYYIDRDSNVEFVDLKDDEGARI